MNDKNYTVSDNVLKQVADIVEKVSGIYFTESNYSILESRIIRKLKQHQVDDEIYLSILKNNPDELKNFISFVTTKFTSFFRNPSHFELLVKNILPNLLKLNASRKSLKIWSAACSTGEEPYSIAITIWEFLAKNNIDPTTWDVQIVASDISFEALITAKEALYRPIQVGKIKPNYLNKYFTYIPDGDLYHINESLSKWIKWDYHNLINPTSYINFDFAFCRNVLIYFESPIQEKVIRHIYDALKNPGWLIIGHSESLITLNTPFNHKVYPEGIIYTKGDVNV